MPYWTEEEGGKTYLYAASGDEDGLINLMLNWAEGTKYIPTVENREELKTRLKTERYYRHNGIVTRLIDGVPSSLEPL